MISETLPWLELNLLESGWCFLVILTAAVIRGYSGFGFSALTVAGLTLILPPAEVIPIAFLLEIGASIHMLPLVWKDIDWNRLRWLTMGMLIATPIGVYLLSILPEIPTRWLVLSLIFIAGLLLLKGYQLKEASSGKSLTFGVGLLSGWVNGTTAVASSGVQSARLAVIDHSYRFLFEGDASDFATADPAFRTIIDSFRPLTAREKVTGTSHTLHYIQVPRGATFASLASGVKLPDAENQLRLINGYYPTGEPRTGDWVKVIR